MQDVEIKVRTHHFECDVSKVAVIQTYGLIAIMMGFIASAIFNQVFFPPSHYHISLCINHFASKRVFLCKESIRMLS